MANPFQWASYTAPTMNMATGVNGTQGFFRPENSQMMSGQALQQYLTAGGTPTSEINRTTKFDGGLTREMLGSTTGFLNDQLGKGFGDLNDALQYGGNFGDRNSPVYSPTSQNGYGTGWGGNNPFKIGSF